MAQYVSFDFLKVVISENWKLLDLVDVKISILRYLGKHTGFHSRDFLKSFWKRPKYYLQSEWKGVVLLIILS